MTTELDTEHVHMAPGIDKIERHVLDLLSERGEVTPSELLRLLRTDDAEATNQGLRLAIWRLVERGVVDLGLDRKLSFDRSSQVA